MEYKELTTRNITVLGKSIQALVISGSMVFLCSLAVTSFFGRIAQTFGYSTPVLDLFYNPEYYVGPVKVMAVIFFACFIVSCFLTIWSLFRYIALVRQHRAENKEKPVEPESASE